jgi:phospholipase C
LFLIRLKTLANARDSTRQPSAPRTYLPFAPSVRALFRLHEESKSSLDPRNHLEPQRLAQLTALRGSSGGTFDISGFRVPLMVISPYAKPNFISHTPRDYTAILAFIEQQFGIPALTQRDAYWQSQKPTMADDFFDFTTPALLNGPGGQPWTQVLNPQVTTRVCDQTKEAGPTVK